VVLTALRSVIGGRLSVTFHGSRSSCSDPSRPTYVRVTQSSFGGNWMFSGLRVRDSSPRARLAASLLPANWSPLSATARAIGVPFQWVTLTPGPNCGGALNPATTRVTR
jgi:hypothetical protein